MTRRLPRVLAACGVAALAPSVAFAAPSTPPRITVVPPAYTSGDSATLTWQQATFSADTTAHTYIVGVRDETTGTDRPDVRVPATTYGATVTGLEDGHAYTFTVRAGERPCADVSCTTPGPEEVSDADSVTTRMDASAPTGAVTINGGAAYTSTPYVTLDLTATDPAGADADAPGSGVDGVQVNDSPTFRCSSLLLTWDCPVGFASQVPATLYGPDGVSTVYVRFVDGARAWSGWSLGNASPMASDTIVLDRIPPSVQLALSSSATDAGVVLTATASVTDATSGADPATATWTFGDGSATVAGLGASHTYTAAGTYQGHFTIADRAGNVQTAPFTMTVTGVPTAPNGPSTPVGETPPTSTPSAVTGTPTGVTITPSPVVTTDARPTPAAATVRRATTPRVTAVTVLGVSRAGKTVRVRARISAKGPLYVAIQRTTKATRTRKARVVTVRQTRRIAGPGNVTFTLKAPVAGRYRVAAWSGTSVRRAALTVRAR